MLPDCLRLGTEKSRETAKLIGGGERGHRGGKEKHTWGGGTETHSPNQKCTGGVGGTQKCAKFKIANEKKKVHTVICI